jgi:molybdate transport system substrate-binding protein
MKRGRFATRIACSLAVAIAASTPSGGAAQERTTLTVFAAASLSDAFGEIAREFERVRPGINVRLNLAGSQQLAAQIEQGASADVFAAADERWMGYVRERRLVAMEPLVFARNRLVAIVPRTNPARIRRLQDLAKSGVKLVLCADAVPVGRYSRTVLRNLARDPAFDSDFAARALRNVVSEEENVKAIVAKVQLGEADAGIVYRSDVTLRVARYLRVFEIPESAAVIASYPIATTAGARDPAGAEAFVALVLSAEGQKILERHGFLPAADTAR